MIRESSHYFLLDCTFYLNYNGKTLYAERKVPTRGSFCLSIKSRFSFDDVRLTVKLNRNYFQSLRIIEVYVCTLARHISKSACTRAAVCKIPLYMYNSVIALQNMHLLIIMQNNIFSKLPIPTTFDKVNLTK